MHVDGFRFDLASAFSRRARWLDQLERPTDLRRNPRRSGPGQRATDRRAVGCGGAYQLGESFPGMRWLQWNGRFRDDVRRFVRGDPGMVSALMFRLYGSDDLFPDDRMHAYPPLPERQLRELARRFHAVRSGLVQRPTQLGQRTRQHDGTAENFSWNCGYEGDRRRAGSVWPCCERQAKNFCCLLFLANGTPMFLAGDEFLHTQRGNNNPYNQDNETTWLDWDRLEENHDFFRFFRLMIAFRKAIPRSAAVASGAKTSVWYGSRGPVNMSRESQQLAYYLAGASQHDDDLYVMINTGANRVPFTIAEGRRRDWRRVIDTARKALQMIFRDAGKKRP